METIEVLIDAIKPKEFRDFDTVRILVEKVERGLISKKTFSEEMQELYKLREKVII